MESARALRPMGLLEIIDQAFRLYRANLGLFFGIAAMVYVPLAVIQSVPEIGPYLGMAVSLFVYLLCTGALTKAISDRYLGSQSTVGEAYRYIGARFVPFFVTMLAVYLLMAAGLVALVVGVFVVVFWVAFVTQVFVIEGKRNFAAIWRSKYLIGNGVWGEVLVLNFVVGFIALLIMGAIQALLAPLGLGPESALWMLGGVVSGVGQSVVTPLSIAASVLLYYDSRIRKEGFDLQMLARERGAELPPPAEPPAIAPEITRTPPDERRV